MVLDLGIDRRRYRLRRGGSSPESVIQSPNPVSESPNPVPQRDLLFGTGQGDVQAALSRLWREGISEFRGSFSDWPVTKGE